MGSDATADYYEERWSREVKANLWAMSRSVVILDEIEKLGKKNPKILDLGCGTGWMTQILNQFGEAEGLDLAPDAARRFHPGIRFHDAEHPPSGPFDIIVSQEVLEHADDQAAYLRGAHSLLGQDGFLILTTPNASVSLRHPEFLIQPREKHLTRNELRAILQKEFEVIKIYSFFYGYARWRPYRLQMRFGRMLNAGLHLMAVCRRP